MTTLGLIAAAPLAAAQSSAFEDSLNPRSAEARLTFTVPFGGQATSAEKYAPKLGFGVRHYQNKGSYDFDWALNPNRISHQAFTERNMTLTLSQTPEFALNGKTVYIYDPETLPVSDDVKTAGKIALGAGVITAVVIGGAFALYVISYDGDGT